jgi:hypothetical protein
MFSVPPGDVPNLLGVAWRLADRTGHQDDEDTHPEPIRTHGESLRK